ARTEDRVLEMTERGDGLAHLAQGRWVEWVLLDLHRPTGAHVRAVACYPLCHEPSHPDRLPGREQVVRPLGPQTIGRRGIALRVTHDPRKRGQLVDDHVRPRLPHGL